MGQPHPVNNTAVFVLGSLDLGANVTGAASSTLDNSQLWLYGTTTWEKTLNIIMSNSTITNAGLFKVANGQAIVDSTPPTPTSPQPTSFFDNTGSLIKQAGTAATTIGVAFANQGTLDFNGTTISFAETVEQTGTAAVTDLGGGTMTLTGANLAADTVNPTTFFLSAGELTGAAGATINGSLSNGGLVDFGTAFGSLAISGDYTQTANGTLTINIGGWRSVRRAPHLRRCGPRWPSPGRWEPMGDQLPHPPGRQRRQRVRGHNRPVDGALRHGPGLERLGRVIRRNDKHSGRPNMTSRIATAPHMAFIGLLLALLATGHAQATQPNAPWTSGTGMMNSCELAVSPDGKFIAVYRDRELDLAAVTLWDVAGESKSLPLDSATGLPPAISRSVPTAAT